MSQSMKLIPNPQCQQGGWAGSGLRRNIGALDHIWLNLDNGSLRSGRKHTTGGSKKVYKGT
ncbi:conserved hypothetical protein [Ricinus communis]|uniref:Uncharacterized protein n=1 Tax=Ricinus communis TaxID=3988 RepID=B9RKX0_RICCO|nr:conserved hypothetical protein [Ricinus communis]